MNPEHVLAQLVLRAWPFGRGVSRVMNAFFPNLRFRETIAAIKTTDGIRLKIFPNDLIGRLLYLTGEYERSVLDVLYRFADKGDVLLDIGANIGYISACFLHKVPESKVIAVEPQPAILDLLAENVSQFPERFALFPFAIAEKSGIANFTLDHDNLGNGRIAPPELPGIPVQTVLGDELLKSVQRIDLIKIDVQGYEEQVLNSMAATVDRLRPKVILFEEDNKKAAPNQPIGSLLNSLGYKVFGIDKRMFGFALRPIETEQQCTCDNYLAIREKHEEPPFDENQLKKHSFEE